VAALGGSGAWAWAGLTYVLLGPALALNGALTGRRVRRLRAEEQAPTGAEGPVRAGAEKPGTPEHPVRPGMQISGAAPLQ